MTFYTEEVHRIKKQHLPHQEIINRIIQSKNLARNSFEKKTTIAMLAESAALSKFHFIRLFRKCYGETPQVMLTAEKMRIAKTLVVRGTPAKEICDALGFESLQSFSIKFKKRYGKSPRDFYKKQHSISSITNPS